MRLPLDRTGLAYGVAAVAPALLAVIAWTLTDVAVGEWARFLAYEALLIVLPGYLAWRALAGGHGPVLDLAIGWALGYAIELAGFALAGELGVAWLGAALQAAVAVGAGIVLVVRPRTGRRPALRVGPAWALATSAVACLAIAYLALASFTKTPLPGEFGEGAYFLDLLFQLGLAAEALHHWPITDPKVVGEPMPYHTFVDMHMAAVARTTGIELPVVLFRLYTVPLFALFALLVATTGTALSGRRWVGPAAALILVAVGELDADPDNTYVFFNTFFFSLHASSSFLFGLPFFLAIVLVAWSCTDAGAGGHRPGTGRLVALGALLLASSGAKASILPVVIAGVTGYLAARWLLERVLDRGALRVLGLAVVAFGLSYAVLYRGATGGLAFDPPGTLDLMASTRLIEPEGSLGRALVLWPLAIAIGLAGFAAAPLGGALLAPLRAWLQPWRLLLLAMLLASLVPMIAMKQIGTSQNFFTYYGYVAGGILAADALITLARRLSAGHGRFPVRVWGLAFIGTVTTVVGIAAAFDGRATRFFLIALGALLATVAVLSLAAAWTARSRPALRAAFLGVPVAALLGAGAVDTPLDFAPQLWERARAGAPLYDREDRQASAGLLAALEWVRDETGEDTVLAVNNHYLARDERGPGFMYYTGFGERRVFLESWGYTHEATIVGSEDVVAGEIIPFPERLALNDAAFASGDRTALGRLVREHGVDLLFVDVYNEGPSGALRRLGAPVFANGDAEIYDARRILANAEGLR